MLEPLARTPSGQRGDHRYRPMQVLVIVVLLALLVRVVAMGVDAFPANDGGMFAAMIENLRANGYRLPVETTYNNLDLPFAYPPLAFYLGALVSAIPGIDTLQALRIVPLVTSTLTVVAMYPFARRVLKNEWHAVLAVVVFALLPRTFVWQVMGGGLTRSTGMLFAVLALSPLYDVYAGNRRRAAPLATVLVALAWLSHLEMGLFATYSAALMFALHREDMWAKLRVTVAMGAAVALLTAPWWGTVLAYHGVSPFIDAGGSSNWTPQGLVQLALFRFSDMPGLDVFSAFGLVGVFWCLRERRWLLPLWLLVIFAIDPRKSATLSMPALSLLAAEGITQVVLPALRSTGGARRLDPSGAFLAAVLVIGTLGGLLASVLTPAYTWSPTSMLPEGDRVAMQWVADSTPESSQFLVLDDALSWELDHVSEWFPYLAGRASLATPQGWEWDSEYYEQIDRYRTLQHCRTADAACLVEWSNANGMPFTHVYVSSRPSTGGGNSVIGRLAHCCEALRASLLASPDFRLVHSEGDLVFVFEYLGATSSTALFPDSPAPMISRGDGAP